MSKRKFMNCHNITIERWQKNFGDDPRLSNLFDDFYTLVETRHTYAVRVRELDVAYAEGSVSKHDYREGKRPYESQLKNIKPKLRKIFDHLFCNLLVAGNSGKCYICGEHLDMNTEFNRDHVFPKVMGFGIGGNMMPAHYHCNQGKDQRLPHDHEVVQAVNAYRFADVPFNPRRAKIGVMELLPQYSGIIPTPVHGKGFRYV